MSAARSRELANEIARRAIAAAERRRAAEVAGDDVAERLRAAAGDDGRLSVDEAVEVLAGDDPAPVVNPLTEYAARKDAKQRAFGERIFPSAREPESAPASDRPEGDVGSGKGDAGEQTYERTQSGELMEVLDLDALMSPNERTDDDA